MILTRQKEKDWKEGKDDGKFSEMKYVRPEWGSVYPDHPERNKEL